MVIDTQKKMLVNEGVYKKTIFFDFNGTIIDDLDLCLNILNEMLIKKGLNPVSKERYKDIFTFPIKDYYIEAGFDFSKYSFEELSKDFIVKYQKPSLSCPLHEGIVDILKKLRDEGYNVVLLTASKRSNVLEQLQSFDILKYFNEVLGIDDIYASSKVQIGLDYMKNYEIDPKNAIMVGDTLHDALVASEMGIDVLLYSKGHQSRKRLESSNQKVIDNLSEIFKYI
jgi:phosphoglycolate phosphatase